MKPHILKRETVYSGYLTVERLRVRLADGAETWLELEKHGEAVVVLPFDAARRCALVARLFRVAVFDTTGQEVLEEACAGMIGDEDAETAARREAYEELGVQLKSLQFLGRVWSSPGVSTERHSLFLAPYTEADRVSAGGGAAGEHEGITVVERPLRELAAQADHGHVTDAKLLSLILALRQMRPELFASGSEADEVSR